VILSSADVVEINVAFIVQVLKTYADLSGVASIPHINPASLYVWVAGASSNTRILCRTSPHRCLLASRPAPPAACTAIVASPTEHALTPGGAAFVGLDDEYVYACDDGGVTRTVMRCDVGGTWVVRTVASYQGYWLDAIGD
jgi:hypothetical protein